MSTLHLRFRPMSTLYLQRPQRLHGCYRTTALPHPWAPHCTDVACGYDERLSDPHCQGCHRSRAESPLDQLHTLDQRHTKDGISQ